VREIRKGGEREGGNGEGGIERQKEGKEKEDSGLVGREKEH